jgi:hypothetical protein
VKNMINSTKEAELALRKLGGVLNFSLFFHLLFTAFLPNFKFCLSAILDDHFLSLSLVCDHLVVLQLVLNSKFKLCALEVVNVLIKGEIEKPSSLCLGLYV